MQQVLEITVENLFLTDDHGVTQPIHMLSMSIVTFRSATVFYSLSVLYSCIEYTSKQSFENSITRFYIYSYSMYKRATSVTEGEVGPVKLV